MPNSSYTATAADGIHQAGSHSLPVQSEGLTLLAAALARVAQEQMVPRRDPLIRDVYDAYLLWAEREGDLAPGTLDVCNQARVLLRPHLGDARASGMSRALTDGLLSALLGDGLRLSTARGRLAKLRAAWTWALDLGMVDRPWAQPPRRARRNKSTPKRAFEVGELATVLGRLKHHYRVPAQALAETGARPDELLSADCSALLRYPDGTWLQLTTGKGQGVDRLVPLLPHTARVLLELADGRTGALFVGERDGKRLKVGTLRKHVSLACADMRRRIGPQTRGASYDLDLYSLRRSWIRHARQAGVAEATRRKIVGHSKRDVHMGYDWAVSRPELREAVVRVAQWRSAEFRSQAFMAQAVASGRWARGTAPHKDFTGPDWFAGGANRLATLEPATGSSGEARAQALRFLTARMAVKRAAVRLAGLRGFVLHAQPEVYSVT